MTVHRLRRWPNITPTLGQRLVFAERHVYSPTRGIGPMLVQYWFTVCYAGPTLNQDCVNVAQFTGVCRPIERTQCTLAVPCREECPHMYTCWSGLSTGECTTSGRWRANVGPTLLVLGRHCTDTITRTQWQHYNQTPALCLL